MREPMTVATDYLLGALALVLAFRLWREASAPERSATRWWAAGLAATGVAAINGGTWHGWVATLAPAAAANLWRTALWASALASFSIVVGSARATLSAPARRWWIGAAFAKLALLAVWTLGHDDFAAALVDQATALLAVLGLHLWARREGTGWMVAGVLVAFAAAVAQATRLTIAASFNHNDLYHAVEVVALVVFARGASALRDHP